MTGTDGTSGSGLSGRPSSGVDMQPWELAWQDLTILKPVGEGSFGRVFEAIWHETSVGKCRLVRDMMMHLHQINLLKHPALPSSLAAVKVLLMGGAIASPEQAQQALALSSPVLRKLEEEAGLLASLR